MLKFFNKYLPEILLGVAIISVVLGVMHLVAPASPMTDAVVRTHLVKLYSPMGQCTGVRVTAPTGMVYTLTAAHCQALLINDLVIAQDEFGTEAILYLIETDKYSDLMLLSSSESRGLKVADTLATHELVHTITHGGGMPSYRTDGEIISTGMIYGLDIETAYFATVTTAAAVPGSSGGPLLNQRNELVGIVSAGDRNGFIYCAALSSIKDFLRNK